MKNYIIHICLIFFLIIHVSAQTGSTVNDPATGLQFTVPEGWSGQKVEAGYLMGSITKKGFILIFYHQYSNLDQIRNEAAQGIADQNGTMLYLQGSLNSINNGLAGIFSGTIEWQQARAYVASIISPHGEGGISIMAAVEEASYNKEYQGLVESIVKSVKFQKPKVHPVDTQWKEKLNDCRLTYMNSYNSGYGGGGYQDKTIIDLCSKGYFNYNDHSETVINAGDNAGGYSTGTSQGSGQWKVISRENQSILQLTFYSGQIYEYVLTEQDGKTYLDGYRYFRTYTNSSVDSGRPNCF